MSRTMASRSAVPDSSTGGATTTRGATLRSTPAGPVVVGAATLAPPRRASTVATLPWPLLGVRPGRGSRPAMPTPPMFLNASSIGRSTPPDASTSAIGDVPSAARAVIILMRPLLRTWASRMSRRTSADGRWGRDGGGAGRGRGVDDGAGAMATAGAGGGAGRGVRTRWLTKRSGTSSIDGRRGHSTWRR
jgi:hypothetical protein